MPLDLTALKAELNRNKEVDDSAKVAMARLLAEVEANKNDPAALQEVVDEWRAQNDSLAAAVANTSGAPLE